MLLNKQKNASLEFWKKKCHNLYGKMPHFDASLVILRLFVCFLTAAALIFVINNNIFPDNSMKNDDDDDVFFHSLLSLSLPQNETALLMLIP